MESIWKEINTIRTNRTTTIDYNNYNRYMVVSDGHDKTKTAYCFGVPIYNPFTRSIPEMKFFHSKANSIHIGSNATITVTDVAQLKDQYGSCYVSLPGTISRKTVDAIFFTTESGYAEMRPTLNGLYFKVPRSQSSTIRLCTNRLFDSVKSNNKYFAIMNQTVIPFITVSCIGTLNEHDNVIAPCEVVFQKVNEKEYLLTFQTKSKLGTYFAYEINMYEPKLFQDTTVESKHPTMNNVYGGTAFLGNTDEFGEQWLYSRLEFSCLPELQNKRILKAIWHIPKLNNSKITLAANNISARFCSFGSNWNNKISIAEPIAESIFSKGYHHLDITTMIDRIKKGDNNFVIRSQTSNNKPAVISTGDSFFQPHILEVTYR